MKFTGEQLTRYSRHLVLPEIGQLGQKKLLEARVFVVGIGGLGSAVGYYLSAVGLAQSHWLTMTKSRSVIFSVR